MSLPDITILIGPHTRLALAINSTVRGQRGKLAAAGVAAFPNRAASPIVRHLAAQAMPADARRTTFEARLAPDQANFLAALNFLGAPARSINLEVLLCRLPSASLGVQYQAFLLKSFESHLRLLFLGKRNQPYLSAVESTLLVLMV